MLPLKKPLRPLVEGVISWNIDTACNYDCSYCTQKNKKGRGELARDAQSFLRAFDVLPGEWEVKISGGEPFLQPDLLDIARELTRRGHWISVVTNFSPPEDRLRDLVKAASGRFLVLSASLHLEHVSPGDFLEKALRVKEELLPPSSLNVTSVARKDNLDALLEIRRMFIRRGVDFKVQPEKKERDVIDFSPEEKEKIRRLGGHCGTGELDHCFQGLPCRAGYRYFILDHRGEAYRCYPARRYKEERLGNFPLGDFSLFDGPRPCVYKYCSCTVPILRGMVGASVE